MYYFQIEPNETGAHANQSMMLKKAHLMGHRILLFARLLAFWVCSWMNSPIRNKAELSSIQKATFITAIADKKITSVFCVFGCTVIPASVCCSN